MYIEQIELRDFRNYEHFKASLSPGLNFFIGANGQGKTNILEAIYLSTHGRSFRPSDNDYFLRRAADSEISKGRVTTRIKKNNLRHEVIFEFDKLQKTFHLNSKKISANKLIPNFPTILFSPESLSVIKGQPEERRRLLDELVLTLEPNRQKMFEDFFKALKTRNKILFQISQSKDDKRELYGTFNALNKIFILLATQVSIDRIKTIKKVQGDFSKIAAKILGIENVDISLEYYISGESAIDKSEDQVFELLKKRLNELHSAETAKGSSLVGPQKHDVKFLFNGNDSRFYCSQGQQRALILALKIAQIVVHQKTRGFYPILLLDDVLSELDFRKRENLVNFINEISAQVLVTSTELMWSSELEINRDCVFEIQSGALKI